MAASGSATGSLDELKPLPKIPPKSHATWRDPPPRATTVSKAALKQLSLPPNYQRHLRALVAQAATQVSISTPDDLGGSHLVVWDEGRRAKWVDAVWNVAIGAGRDGKGFMDLPISQWIPGIQRRRDAWKARKRMAVPATPLASPALSQTQRMKLSVMTPADRPSTPNPDSSADFAKRPASPSDIDDAEVYKAKLKELPGYLPYESSVWSAADWTHVEDQDDYAEAKAPRATIPGAFPHTDAYVYESLPPPHTLFHTSRDPGEAQAPGSASLVNITEGSIKVVYCLHVPATQPLQPLARSSSAPGHPSRGTASSSSTATARTIDRRSSELGGSWNRWGSAKTLTSVQSTSTFSSATGRRLEAPVLPEIVKVEFWPGRFALGTSPAEAEGSASESDLLDDAMLSSSVSSEPYEGHDAAEARSKIISGGEDDLVEGDLVSLVGGTFVLRGLSPDEPYRTKEIAAVEKILRILIYSLYAMRLELAVMDTYGVPREEAPPAVPEKPVPQVPSSALEAPRGSTVHTVHPRKGAKSFFSKLGGDSKSSWGSWLRRKDSRGRVEDVLSRSKTSETIAPTAAVDAQPAALPTDTPPSELDPTAAAETVAMTAYERHIQTLNKLQGLKLSTTPGLVFPMPPLLLRIAEEDQQRQAFLHASDTSAVGLSSTVLHKPRPSAHRLGGDIRAGLNAIWPHAETYEGWVRLQSIDVLHSTIRRVPGDAEGLAGTAEVCLQPQHISYRYFDAEADETLGQKLDQLFSPAADDVCAAPTCDGLPAEHEQSWTHAGLRVVLHTREAPLVPLQEQLESPMDDETWTECEECGARSEVCSVGELARMFSWGRYLEILLYHHGSFGPPRLCPHSLAPRSWHFRRRATILRFSRDIVDVLETRMPKLQVGPNVPQRKAGVEAAAHAVNALLQPEQAQNLAETTKREIEVFYVSLERVIAVLKEAMPSATSAVERSGDLESTSELAVIIAAYREDEAALYDQLGACQMGQMNNVRRQFLQKGRAIRACLQQLQVAEGLELERDWLSLAEPNYFTDPAVHVLPGSSIIVRDDDPSSIIAYTLSSLEYHTELTNFAKAGAAVDRKISERRGTGIPGHEDHQDGSDADASAAEQSSGLIAAAPDEHQADSWSSEVKRIDTPRDLSLLSLRSITKKKSDGALSLAPSLKTPLAPKPQAPASLEVSLASAEGKGQIHNVLGELVKTIGKATASIDEHSTARLDAVSHKARPSILDTNGSSVLRADSNRTLTPPKTAFDTEGCQANAIIRNPPSAFKGSRRIEAELPASPPGSPSREASTSRPREGWSSSLSTNISSSFSQLVSMGDTLAGSFRMRTSSGGERSTLASLMGPLSKLSTMDTSLSTFDDKPHINFAYSVGDKLKLTCTVYYATAFDSLRRRCAIDKAFVTSLARTTGWDAQGGKSKACFFKTSDDRFIVKELVSKWGASDTHALLEIAPSYFEHIAASQNRATSLAKIVGFYTVKIQDASGGSAGNRKPLDLLVMENIFHEQKITRTFDLKGIEGRKVPVKAGPDNIIAPATLFDGEWLEGQRKSPILLHPHSRRMLREAIANDVIFLSQNAIMDYSLLLGLDEIRGELVTGIVDAIGSYNLLKTLESRSKLALNRGGDVTIIPPDQYRERFETALKQYFISCPDKWSRPPIKTPRLRPLAARDILPSVV